VDVLLASNSGSWGALPYGSGRLADYNAAGTLWLLGNNVSVWGRSLVVGNAPLATIVAIGNLSFDDKSLLPVVAARKVAVGNLFTHYFLTGRKEEPSIRLIRSASKLSDQPFPTIPDVPLPPAIPRPRLSRPFPGMLNVKDFGAVGDGLEDDTASIQAALDANCGKNLAKLLFFPAGTYRVSRTLAFNHRDAACRTHPPGGWLAGEGRDRTVIVRDARGAGGVFASEALAYITIQGITFKTSAYEGEARNRLREAAFSLEHASGSKPASQEVIFYDVRFDGGRYGLGIGLDSETQCSENLMIDTEFRNAGHGMAVGSYNALANLVYGGRFIDNDTAIGHVAEKRSGGTWAVLGADVSGTRDHDFSFFNSAAGVWYFRDLTTRSRVVADVAVGAAIPLLFEGLKLAPSTPASGKPNFTFGAAGGLIFLRSEANQASVRLAGKPGLNVAINLYGRMPGWRSAETGPADQIHELGQPAPGPGPMESR